MKSNNYIEKIIEKTGLSKKEIENMVEEKKQELKGLISEEGALFIIAKELGVDVKENNEKILTDIDIKVSDIKPNMKNITLIGRIKEIYRINKFKRNDGSEGLVGSFLLHDETGDIRVVLWDEQTNILNENNFQINELVKILNGYAKEGKRGGLEMHIGRYSKMIVAPDDVDYKKYPKISKNYIEIKDISLSQPSVSVKGKIIRIFSLNEFVRKDGNAGKVRSLVLMDNTGSIRITFWNDMTQILDSFEVGDYVSIISLNPRLNEYNTKSIELYGNQNTKIEKQKEIEEISAEIIKKIEALQNENRKLVSFKGIITSIDNLREISLKSGDNVSLLSFNVSDDTDSIKVTLWRENAEKFSKKLSINKGVFLKNVMVRYSKFSGRNEITYISDSTLEIIELEFENLKVAKPIKAKDKAKFSNSYTRIKDINSDGVYEIRGMMIKELNKITLYEACSNCFKKIENCNCDNQGKTEHRMILNVILDDETGTIRTTFIGNTAEKFLEEKTHTLLQLQEESNLQEFLAEKSKNLIGNELIIKGRAKYSDFSNSYEIVVYDFKFLEIDEDLERLIEEIGI
ncbi:MAG: DUF2240 family protein [Candidatus Lokiarchaeota archaeon]|nr:DUF2240 family protein [Candidatus Lokiarchaeota archaeon]